MIRVAATASARHCLPAILILAIAWPGAQAWSQNCRGLQSFRMSPRKIGIAATFNERTQTLAGSLSTGTGSAFVGVSLGAGRSTRSARTFLVESSVVGFEFPV